MTDYAAFAEVHRSGTVTAPPVFVGRTKPFGARAGEGLQ